MDHAFNRGNVVSLLSGIQYLANYLLLKWLNGLEQFIWFHLSCHYETEVVRAIVGPMIVTHLPVNNKL